LKPAACIRHVTVPGAMRRADLVMGSGIMEHASISRARQCLCVS
jgi:hypothetical protein